MTSNNYDADDDALLQAAGVSIDSHFTQIEGHVLSAPKMKVGNGEDFSPRNGRWNFNHKSIRLLQPTKIERWAIVNFSVRGDVEKLWQDLRQEGLSNKVLQWYLCRMEGWFATDADTISLKYWDQEELLSGGHGLMINGYRPVINSVAKGLDIRLNHKVTKITYRYNGVKITIDNGRTFVADVVVVVVPIGVLKAKRISFEPRLPQWKETAIADIGVGVENKIALHFDKVFWPNVEFLGVVAPNSYGCSYFLNLHKATGRPILVYIPAGRLALDMEKMSDEAAASVAFMQLKKGLPEASEPIQYLVSHWGKDINSLGSYTFDIVGKPHDLYDRLRVPVENISFAGEATSAKYPGTVHGAFSTCVMAAEECRMYVLERYGELDLFQPAMGGNRPQ